MLSFEGWGLGGEGLRWWLDLGGVRGGLGGLFKFI